MSQRRFFLYVAVIALFFMLWQKWQAGLHPSDLKNVAVSKSKVAPSIPIKLSTSVPTQTKHADHSAHTKATHTQVIKIDTDVLHVGIDTRGGHIVQLDLLKYPLNISDTKKPVSLFTQNKQGFYVAQSGLVSKMGPDTVTEGGLYTTAKTNYVMQPDQNSLDISLTWKNKDGLKVTKIFTFQRGKYEIAVRYRVENHTHQPWSGQFYAQLKQTKAQAKHRFFGLHTYTGAAISSAADHYEKLKFATLEKENLDRTIQGGWLAMQQRYFLGAWIPNAHDQNRYYSRFSPEQDSYTLGYVGPLLTVPETQVGTVQAKLYAGPELADKLSQVAPHLALTIDYGWLWPISVFLFMLMKYIHRVLGNWGWSIVIVTLCIKLIFYKFSATSYRSMAKMRKLAPQMRAVQERFKEDKAKLSQAMMELYRKHKINPLGGCLPMVIQIPFFIALYYVLIESVALRQAPFIFWIHDLSVRDPYFVLPILMGLSMLVQQKLSPSAPDPLQAKMLMLLPIIFTVFFATFPAGLVLYWLVNNCVSVLQQWYITKQLS